MNTENRFSSKKKKCLTADLLAMLAGGPWNTIFKVLTQKINLKFYTYFYNFLRSEVKVKKNFKQWCENLPSTYSY